MSNSSISAFPTESGFICGSGAFDVHIESMFFSDEK